MKVRTCIYMLASYFKTKQKYVVQILKSISLILIVYIPLAYGQVSWVQNLPGQRIEVVKDWNDQHMEIKEHEQDDMEGSELVERPDDIEVDEFYTLAVFKRPVLVGLEYESNMEFFIDFELKRDAEDDLMVIEQKLVPEIFYALTEDISLYMCLDLFYEGKFHTETNTHHNLTAIERKELWLFVGNMFDSNFSLQIGRQEVDETRQWWWGDEALDAIRVHYDSLSLHGELLVAQELAKSTTAVKYIEPEKEDILRVMGQLAWARDDDHRLDAFFLYQNDHSSGQYIGDIDDENSEDPSDADLLWIGGRASGQLDTESFGEIQYWFDAAGVFGKEELLEFDEFETGESQVSSLIKRDVAGWGFDMGLTWWTALKGRPYLNFGYAWGSGDRESDQGMDQSFRQTGLQGSEYRFPYYGILLDPELSNLQILTTSLGFRFRESSFVELVYHDYKQVRSSSFLRGAEIEVDLEGGSRDVGYEWDLVLVIDDCENLEFKFFGALFRAGSAFGSLSSEKAYYTGIETIFRF